MKIIKVPISIYYTHVGARFTIISRQVYDEKSSCRIGHETDPKYALCEIPEDIFNSQVRACVDVEELAECLYFIDLNRIKDMDYKQTVQEILDDNKE